jgi:hypothetical protein
MVHVERALFARNELFILAAIGDTIVDQLVRRLGGVRRHHFAGRGIGLDHRRRRARSGRAEKRAIAERAGRAQHDQREHGSDLHNADTPARRRRRGVVSILVFVERWHRLTAIAVGFVTGLRRVIGRLVVGMIVIALRRVGRLRRISLARRGCSRRRPLYVAVIAGTIGRG